MQIITRPDIILTFFYLEQSFKIFYFSFLYFFLFFFFFFGTVKILSTETDRCEQTVQTQIRFLGYKTFFMLNLAEHEIIPANKC